MLTGKELIRRVSFGSELKREEHIAQIPIKRPDPEPTNSATNRTQPEAVKSPNNQAQPEAVKSPISQAQPEAVMSPTNRAQPEMRHQKNDARPPEIFETSRNQEYLKRMQEEQEAKILKFAEETKKYEQLKFLDPEHKVHFRIVGQIFDTYWIVEFRQNMYIIDQHAAHEKVLYERFCRFFEKQSIPSQMLAPAAVLFVSETERVSLTKNMENLRKMGFEIEDFGGNEIKINAVPSLLPSVEKIEVLKELIAQFSDREHVKTPELIIAKLASLSCKAAVKGNTRLSMSEVNALLDELFETQNPYTCPHGRPTIIEMSKTELEKKFKRIV